MIAFECWEDMWCRKNGCNVCVCDYDATASRYLMNRLAACLLQGQGNGGHI